MSDFAMHYRTKFEQNNEKPVSEKANENARCASEKVEEIKNFQSTKKCSKQNVVSALGNGESENKSNQNKNYVTIGYDCLFVDDDADEEEVFKNRPKVEKKSKKLKVKRNKNQSAHGSNHEESSGKNNINSADSGHEPAVNEEFTKQINNKRAYKESTSIDSGIECESNPNFSPSNFLQNIDNNFGEFLLDNEDNFLDNALDYISPKFSCNRFDNILAFTLHAKNVVVNTIECQKLGDIGAARIKFYSNTSQQHYAFFVKITPPLHSSSVLSQHFNENNNTAMVTDVSAETWDNNVVFQIELDSVIARDVEEYYCGVSKYELEPKQLSAKVLQSIPEPCNGVNNGVTGQEDEGLSIEVENSSESEISIAIKRKENKIQTTTSVGTGNKRRNKKKKNRSYSESCCDELKVVSESEILNTEPESPQKCHAMNKNNVNVPRKVRSISECAYTSEEPDHHIKYKSILKHSSFDSSADDLFYSTSFDIQMNGGGSTDPEMSESCKKSVRFSDHITRQLFRSTSSILAQKKKNQRKNEAKRRLLERKNSECESAEEINDIPEDEPEEEEEEEEQVTHIEIPTKSKKNKKRGLETTKSNMIFDLEI